MESRGNDPDEQAAGGKNRSKGVFFAIIAVVILGAVIAGVWWAIVWFGGPQEQDVVGAVDGYFEAAASNDREGASNYIYMGEDAEELGADDFNGEFDPETFFAYRAVTPHHFFAGDNGAYVYGLIEYNERPIREFTAILRQRAQDGQWGLLRLWLSEPMTTETPASMLVGEVLAE